MSGLLHFHHLLTKLQDEYESLWTEYESLWTAHAALQYHGCQLEGPSCDLAPVESIPKTSKPSLLSNSALAEGTPLLRSSREEVADETVLSPIGPVAGPPLKTPSGKVHFPRHVKVLEDDADRTLEFTPDTELEEAAGKVSFRAHEEGDNSSACGIVAAAEEPLQLHTLVSASHQVGQFAAPRSRISSRISQRTIQRRSKNSLERGDSFLSSMPCDQLEDAGTRRRMSRSSAYSVDIHPSVPFSSVFPVWWNPSRQSLNKLKEVQASRMESLLIVQKGLKSSRWVLSPVGFCRLLWDFISGLLILYDAWATPFEIIYCSSSLNWGTFDIYNWIIVGFFSCDILLNFNTGYVIKDRMIFERRKIIWHYIKFWFWLDLFATVPFDQLINVGQMGRSLRFFKAVKALKTIRFFKLVQTLKSLKNPYNDKLLEAVKSYKMLSYFIASVVILMFFVHVHTCIFAVLKTDALKAERISQALDEYFRDFQLVYLLAISGTSMNSQTSRMKVFEMILATEHSALLILLTAWAAFKADILHGDAARAQLMHEQSLRYMRRHRLSPTTQIQVMYGLHEAGSAKAMQKDFISLMESDLPQELQRNISYELWGQKLKTLGLILLISDWDPDVMTNLALLCREEVLATNSLLFSAEEASYAAYHIINGDIRASCPLTDDIAFSNFGAGMWLGENALVNPCFRRGVSATADCLSSVMLVPAEGFQKVIHDAGLQNLFEDWVTKELWRGMCGRCGKLGSHFSDNCPGMSGRIATVKAARRDRITAFFQEEPKDHQRSFALREFREFLRNFKIDHLEEHLEGMGATDLDTLQALNMESFQSYLKKMAPSVRLSKHEMRSLSRSSIQSFQQKMRKAMSRLHRTGSTEEHLLFLSHYKLEAGTEAALMRAELEQLLAAEDPELLLLSNEFQVPVFLDSEDLTSLKELEQHVKRSHNVVLLLTRGVLTRPWCLVELVTAVKSEIPVVLVEVAKQGNEFNFPDDKFYTSLRDGSILDSSAMQVLASCDIDSALVERTIREIFKSIAVPYSPHRPVHVRRAELKMILQQCQHLETKQKIVRTLTGDAKMHRVLSTQRSTQPVTKSV